LILTGLAYNTRANSQAVDLTAIHDVEISHEVFKIVKSECLRTLQNIISETSPGKTVTKIKSIYLVWEIERKVSALSKLLKDDGFVHIHLDSMFMRGGMWGI
jgi:hypothetical protein